MKIKLLIVIFNIVVLSTFFTDVEANSASSCIGFYKSKLSPIKMGWTKSSRLAQTVRRLWSGLRRSYRGLTVSEGNLLLAKLNDPMAARKFKIDPPGQSLSEGLFLLDDAQLDPYFYNWLRQTEKIASSIRDELEIVESITRFTRSTFDRKSGHLANLQSSLVGRHPTFGRNQATVRIGEFISIGYGE